MKFLVALCLFALAVAEEDSQEQSQSVENTQTSKPTLASTPSTQSFGTSQVFTPSALNFGNKDGFGGAVTFPGFAGSFPALQTSDLFGTGTGVVTGTVPQFAQVARTVVPSNGATFPGNVQNSPFAVTNGVLATVPSVAGGLGTQFASLPATRVLTGYQGVPAGTATFGAGYQLPTSPYRFVTQDGLAGFPHQGPSSGTAGVPVFPSGVLTPLSSAVFPGTQGVLKTPGAGTSVNVPNYPTANPGTEQTGTVFRRA